MDDSLDTARGLLLYADEPDVSDERRARYMQEALVYALIAIAERLGAAEQTERLS